LEGAPEGHNAGLPFWILLGSGIHDGDAPYTV
jgi:hypothetical protein